MGALLAQQLVGAGEHIVDVPPQSSRVLFLEAGQFDKTDPNDARSAAIVAWHNFATFTIRPVGLAALPRDQASEVVDATHQPVWSEH